jgi:hypothetical protein
MLLAQIRGWFRWRRHKAVTRELAARNPIRVVITELCIQADEEGIESLTSVQRNVVLAWSALGVIGNGGFQYYYDGTGRMRDVVGAFRVLGFEGAAAACERSMSMFPLGIPPEDPARRAAASATVPWDELEDAESAVFAVEWDALIAAIGAYMRRFPGEFPELR